MNKRLACLVVNMHTVSQLKLTIQFFFTFETNSLSVVVIFALTNHNIKSAIKENGYNFKLRTATYLHIYAFENVRRHEVSM